VDRVDYRAIAASADLTEASLKFIFKQILIAVETAMRKNYPVKLNLKLGFLKFNENKLFFDNIATGAEIDKMTVTSFNTELKGSKMFLAGGRNPFFLDDIAVSSVHEILSRVGGTTKNAHSTQQRFRSSADQVTQRSNTVGAKADPNTIHTQ